MDMEAEFQFPFMRYIIQQKTRSTSSVPNGTSQQLTGKFEWKLENGDNT
jgi:hypothetical protein